ncbi:Uncharacterized protein dnm_098080 [Desulfonema magnum]|uniref:Uncharacterized protein n=1 Tax=Desulfonema magnum TaxID=45655 RepID=A0A975GU23_9BACT|nr:Uncharacterized protein dnm_098080 [Desulfonema magnum]
MTGGEKPGFFMSVSYESRFLYEIPVEKTNFRISHTIKKGITLFIKRNPFNFYGSGGWIRTNDLRVMLTTTVFTA